MAKIKNIIAFRTIRVAVQSSFRCDTIAVKSSTNNMNTVIIAIAIETLGSSKNTFILSRTRAILVLNLFDSSPVVRKVKFLVLLLLYLTC